jgi:hypothetical protein
MMRYRLRTLMIVLAIGPPVLAGVWLAHVWLIENKVSVTSLPILLVAFLVGAIVAVNLKRLMRAGLPRRRGKPK